MRVLVVTTWLPTTDAPQTGLFVERDIDLLARDHDVDVVHLSAAAASDGVARAWRTRTLRMTPSDPRSIAAAARALRPMVGEYDLVHTMAASTLLPFARVMPAVPWVHTEHWSGILSPKTEPWAARLTLPLTMRLFKRPDVVVAVGSELAAAIERRRGSQVRVIPNAVEVSDKLAERDLVDGRVRLVAVGGLIPRKGPDLAVRTVAELVRRGQEASLTWVGEGPMREECIALARHLGVSDRVHFVGSLPSTGVWDQLAQADVFLLPTEAETFGVAIAEALASGRPVVVGADGGHREFVQEPDGVLVGPRTAEAYADGVQRVVELNRTRTASDVARYVAETFTDERRRELYAATYAEALTQLERRGRGHA